jgi:hypothetical protein
MYDTEIHAQRSHQERNVHAWMRAAAYAAGTEPEDDHFGLAARDLAEIPPAESDGLDGALLVASAIRSLA